MCGDETPLQPLNFNLTPQLCKTLILVLLIELLFGREAPTTIWEQHVAEQRFAEHMTGDPDQTSQESFGIFPRNFSKRSQELFPMSCGV